jgi:hypothetical protein
MPKVEAIKIKCRVARWIFLNHRRRRQAPGHRIGNDCGDKAAPRVFRLRLNAAVNELMEIADGKLRETDKA